MTTLADWLMHAVTIALCCWTLIKVHSLTDAQKDAQTEKEMLSPRAPEPAGLQLGPWAQERACGHCGAAWTRVAPGFHEPGCPRAST